MSREYPRRWVRVPWFNSERWNEQEDLTCQGDPELVHLLHKWTLVAMHIKGLPDHQVLCVKEHPNGEIESCAITDELKIDTMTRVPQQSNPRRSTEKDDMA